MDLKKVSISMLSSVTGGVQDGDSMFTLYTVPLGKKCIVDSIVARSPTGSMAGATDFDFGADDSTGGQMWKVGVDLSSLTGYYVIRSDSADNSIFDAEDVILCQVKTGATADVNCTFDVFGYLYDA
jgi:hypothetical protein